MMLHSTASSKYGFPLPSVLNIFTFLFCHLPLTVLSVILSCFPTNMHGVIWMQLCLFFFLSPSFFHLCSTNPFHIPFCLHCLFYSVQRRGQYYCHSSHLLLLNDSVTEISEIEPGFILAFQEVEHLTMDSGALILFYKPVTDCLLRKHLKEKASSIVVLIFQKVV